MLEIAELEKARAFAASTVLHTQKSLVKDELLVKEANLRLVVVTQQLAAARLDATAKRDAAAAAASNIITTENALEAVLSAAQATHARLLIASGVAGAQAYATEKNLLKVASIGCEKGGEGDGEDKS